MNIKYFLRFVSEKQPVVLNSDDLPAGSESFDQISSLLETEPLTLLSKSAGVLEWSYQAGHAVVAIDLDAEDLIVGFTRLELLLGKNHKLGDWYELGSTWVRKSYRGNGINKNMYKKLLSAHEDKNILATTTNSSSVHVGEQLSFVAIPRKKLPDEVWQASCVCPLHKTGASTPENIDCKLARGEPQREGERVCWFRITPSTHARMA